MSDTCDVCEEPAVQWNRDTFDGPVKRACRRHTETPDNILQDLIAELRVNPQPPLVIDGMPVYGKVHGGPSPRTVSNALDRAEARLREVSGE